ncbi:MAG: hypothetical protein P8X74_22325 [Reinekea sp.]
MSILNKALAISGSSAWMAGYFIHVVPEYSIPSNFYDAFGWKGFLIYTSPMVLIFIMAEVKAIKSALVFSILLLSATVFLYLFMMFIILEETKSGTNWIERIMDHHYDEPGWIYLLSGSALITAALIRKSDYYKQSAKDRRDW